MPQTSPIPNKGHIGGMNTVADRKSELFPREQCELLENALPGDPAVPRPGCVDVLVDLTDIGRNDVSTDLATLFRPPAVMVEDSSGNRFAFIIHVVDSDRAYYGVECWDIDNAVGNLNDSRYTVVAGEYGANARFGIVPMFGGLYVVSDIVQADNLLVSDLVTLGHKIVEWDSDNSVWSAREMFLDIYAECSSPVVANKASAGLTYGKWVSYAATFVRHTYDSAFDANDEPDTVSAFVGPVSEGYESTDYRLAVNLDTSTLTGYGDATTQVDVVHVNDDVYMIEHDGTGTPPAFNTLAEDDWVRVAAPDLSSANQGIFKVIDSAAGWFTFENANGVEEDGKTLSSATDISKGYCQVTLDMPTAADCTDAQNKGATHVRLWRTDHGSSKGIAQGLSHRWLVDLPIYGSNSVAGSTYVDSVSDNTLKGETNILSMTNYTAPPARARFVAYVAGRMWMFGDPENRGRAWYTEVPGGDGATQFGMQNAQKYAGMYRISDYWVDCDPDDGMNDTGMAVRGDDLYLFKEYKTFWVPGGNPNVKPQRISASIGCVCSNTLCVMPIPEIGDVIFFISAHGPAAIYPGGQVELLEFFTHEEVWPGGELLQQATGEMMNGYSLDRVFAQYHYDSMWVCYGDSEDENASNKLSTNRILGYYLSPSKKYRGALKVVLEDFDTEME